MKKELCVGSLAAARAASYVNIDRIETCVALEVGGLTPSESMVKWIQDTFDLEQHVLIRQRAGNFVYNYDEVVVMRDQIAAFSKTGIRGLVIGALLADGTLDLAALETWKRAAGQLDLTFHRAFDEVADWRLAMDQLVKLGFKRILTSGQQPNVASGLTNLAEMVGAANGRIEVMAGGGVTPDLLPRLAELGIDAAHFSATKSTVSGEGSLFEATLLELDMERLKSYGF